ncbi:hypothetical protein MTBBW1_440018 [Desulfamplus magnetovallimortis]|uniref:Uncharacterized protein n=1 Tax=Desulfamplus magnetovallimortis TaxID=1246637 RepID=A0A1W1HHA6_9BACT|nr:hypothetical protein MTBBW1_440018 [Desulfamplus magnetovallimortis]
MILEVCILLFLILPMICPSIIDVTTNISFEGLSNLICVIHGVMLDIYAIRDNKDKYAQKIISIHQDCKEIF